MSEDIVQNSEPINEELLIRSAGYLKFPKKFKQLHPEIDAVTPTASSSESSTELHLIFTWNKEELKNTGDKTCQQKKN